MIDYDLELLKIAHKKILDEGGDGWGLILSSRYKELAEKYETIEGHFPKASEADGEIAYIENQEFIVFRFSWFGGEVPYDYEFVLRMN